MASLAIEKDIDDFANNSCVRGKYPLSNVRQVIKDSRYYDRLWASLLKDVEKEQFIESFLEK